MSGAVLVVVPDLFFATRIASTAQQLGVPTVPVAIEEAHEKARAERPALVVLDLHAPGDPIALIRALRDDPTTRDLPLVGFYSHVDQALRERAIAAGLERPLPRAAFTARLAEILQAAGAG